MLTLTITHNDVILNFTAFLCILCTVHCVTVLRFTNCLGLGPRCDRTLHTHCIFSNKENTSVLLVLYHVLHLKVYCRLYYDFVAGMQLECTKRRQTNAKSFTSLLWSIALVHAEYWSHYQLLIDQLLGYQLTCNIQSYLYRGWAHYSPTVLTVILPIPCCQHNLLLQLLPPPQPHPYVLSFGIFDLT